MRAEVDLGVGVKGWGGEKAEAATEEAAVAALRVAAQTEAAVTGVEKVEEAMVEAGRVVMKAMVVTSSCIWWVCGSWRAASGSMVQLGHVPET